MRQTVLHSRAGNASLPPPFLPKGFGSQLFSPTGRNACRQPCRSIDPPTQVIGKIEVASGQLCGEDQVDLHPFRIAEKQRRKTQSFGLNQLRFEKPLLEQLLPCDAPPLGEEIGDQPLLERRDIARGDLDPQVDIAGSGKQRIDLFRRERLQQIGPRSQQKLPNVLAAQNRGKRPPDQFDAENARQTGRFHKFRQEIRQGDRTGHGFPAPANRNLLVEQLFETPQLRRAHRRQRQGGEIRREIEFRVKQPLGLQVGSHPGERRTRAVGKEHLPCDGSVASSDRREFIPASDTTRFRETRRKPQAIASGKNPVSIINNCPLSRLHAFPYYSVFSQHRCRKIPPILRKSGENYRRKNRKECD